MEELKDRLRAARKSAGKTQAQVAEQVGIRQPTYNQLETGKSSGTKYLVQIAHCLDVSATWLATGRGSMRQQAIEDVRLDNLDHLVARRGEQALAAALAGIADLEQLLEGQHNIGNRIARTIEARLDLPQGALDHPGSCADAGAVDHAGGFDMAAPDSAADLPADFLDLLQLIRAGITDGTLDADDAELLKHQVRILTRKK